MSQRGGGPLELRSLWSGFHYEKTYEADADDATEDEIFGNIEIQC